MHLQTHLKVTAVLLDYFKIGIRGTDDTHGILGPILFVRSALDSRITGIQFAQNKRNCMCSFWQGFR